MENACKNYDYATAVKEDFDNAIDEILADPDNGDISADDVYNDYRESITGSDNGSYTCDRAKAAEYVKTFIFGEDWSEFIEWNSLEYDKDFLLEFMADPERLDVLIRDYFLTRNYNEWFNSHEA